MDKVTIWFQRGCYFFLWLLSSLWNTSGM